MLIETILGAAAAGGLYRCQQLKTRIDGLESRLKILEAASAPLSAAAAPPQPTESPISAQSAPPPAATVASPAQAVVIESVVRIEPPPSRPPAAPKEPTAWSQATESVISMVKANPFASLGVLLVLVGVGFLFSLLAASNILPPALRVVLVALAGVGAFAFGIRHEKIRPTFAMNLQGGALAAEYLCALWAYQGYELVTPTIAFAWMGGLSTLAVGWAAYKKRGLFAFMGIAGSLVTPIVASTGSGVFSGLLLYCAWISALGIGAGLYLKTPSLVSATLAGVSALLGAAMGISRGNLTVSLTALLALLGGYSGVAVYWTRKQFAWAASQQASIVGVLLGAPLITVGFMGTMAGLSAKAGALVVGATALVYLVSILRASDAWKGWLLALASGLGVIALGVGLEGASRAMAFAATALGLVMLARAMGKSWAGFAALGYWVLSVLFSVAVLKTGLTLPLVVSGLVGLGAGFVARGSLPAWPYALSAPLILAAALFHGIAVPYYVHLVWFLAWAVVALAVGTRLNWKELRVSAVWLLPAGLPFLVDPSLSSIDRFGREVALASWLALSAFLVWTYKKDDRLPKFKPSADALGKASLLMPLFLSWEMHNLIGASSVFTSLLALLWSSWCAAALHASRKLDFDFKALEVGVAGAVLTAVAVMYDKFGISGEIARWLSVALLVYAGHKVDLAEKGKLVLATYGLAGATLLGTVLRGIGATYGKHDNTFELLFSRVMQPWVSLLWAAAGIAVVVYASRTQSRKLWMAGGVAILVLMLKMLLIDLSTFSLAAKVGVFIVTGVAFIALGRYSPLPPEAAKAP